MHQAVMHSHIPDTLIWMLLFLADKHFNIDGEIHKIASFTLISSSKKWKSWHSLYLKVCNCGSPRGLISIHSGVTE